MFRAFLKLGLTSFGGPVAHLGYFRDELVVRRRWVHEATFADLVALCQFLPGPTSSQVGYALGLLRGGALGGLAAWFAFSLPSVLLLMTFAFGARVLSGPVGAGVVHGLKLMAVAVVAQAVWGMARTLTSDIRGAGIAFAAAAIVLCFAGSPAQIAAIGLGGLAGFWLNPRGSADPPDPLPAPVSRAAGLAALALFLVLLAALPLAAAGGVHGIELFDAFFRSGALVFGGGHVVLPLLEAAVVEPGWIAPGDFLVGYGAAQAVPGPLFTFAAYLGAAMTPEPNGVAGAALCLVAIFLPGLLLVTAALPYWGAGRARPPLQAAMRGASASVVGILAAALYDPLWTGAIGTLADVAVALVGFAMLVVLRLAPWIVVAFSALAGLLLQTSTLP